jgi:hypothetical protein
MKRLSEDCRAGIARLWVVCELRRAVPPYTCTTCLAEPQ